MQNYFENEHVSIGYDKDNRIILTTWLTPPLSSEFREALYATIKAIEYFGAGKVIWDTRLLGLIHPDDQQWAVTVFYTNAVKIGYSHAVFLVPEDIFTQMSIEDTVSQVSDSIPLTYVTSMEAAIKWLQQF